MATASRRQPALAPALVTARKQAGLTQAELAARVGTTQSAIARLERGAVTPSVDMLTRLAEALGVRFEIAAGRGLTARLPAQRPTLQELQARREGIRRVARKHGARSVHVAGSVARGEGAADSDIDLLVEFEPGRTVLDVSGLIVDLEEMLGRTVNVVELGRSSPVVERMLREAVQL